MRLKLIANNTTVERRFSAWIGGSILASLVSWMFASILVLSSWGGGPGGRWHRAHGGVMPMFLFS